MFLWVGSHAPSCGRQVLGAAQPCGVSLTTRHITLASLRYVRIISVARVPEPRCLAGDRLLGCVPAHPWLVVSMASVVVGHGLPCSLAGIRLVALEYGSCYWPGGSAGLPQCVRTSECGLLCPVPLLPCFVVSVRCVVLRMRYPWPIGSCSLLCTLGVLCVRCPWPIGSCSTVCPLGVLCCVCGFLGHLATVQRCARSACCVCSVPGHLAPVHQCACSVCCVACAVS